MRASEMLELDRAMTRADQWEAEDSEDPVAYFKIPDSIGVTVEMLTADAHGAVTMRRHWRPLAKLLAACERRATAICKPDSVLGLYHFTGCHDGRHAARCAVAKAEAEVVAALAAVHATGERAYRNGMPYGNGALRNNGALTDNEGSCDNGALHYNGTQRDNEAPCVNGAPCDDVRPCGNDVCCDADAACDNGVTLKFKANS